MNRIDKRLADCRSKGETALIPFLMAGDPSLDATEEIVLAVEKQGADMILLGVPFSDPMAEKPEVRAAGARALSKNVSLDRIFETTRRLRAHTQIPLVLLMYYNTLFHYGADRFFERCGQAGVDGVMVSDLPFEESDEIFAYTKQYGVHQILCVAYDAERIREIGARAEGFLYCLPMTNRRVTQEEVRACAVSIVVDWEALSAHKVSYADGVIVLNEVAQSVAQAGDDQKSAAKRAAEKVCRLKNELQRMQPFF